MNRRRTALALTVMTAFALTGCATGGESPTAGSTQAIATASGSPNSTPSTPAAAPSVGGHSGTATSTPAAPPAPATVDTDAERAAWEALMGPDGEYAASASYAAVIDAFGAVQPYQRIRAAEERHIAALTNRLTQMGVDVPANPYLGVIAAPADLVTAANAWAQGEIANIALYDRLLPLAAQDAQLTRVFENLRRASAEQHLPAFEAAAAQGGTTG